MSNPAFRLAFLLLCLVGVGPKNGRVVLWPGVGKGPLGRLEHVLMSGEWLFEPRAMHVWNLQFKREAW